MVGSVRACIPYTNTVSGSPTTFVVSIILHALAIPYAFISHNWPLGRIRSPHQPITSQHPGGQQHVPLRNHEWICMIMMSLLAKVEDR